MDSNNLFHVIGSSSGKVARRSGSSPPGFDIGSSGAPTPDALPRTDIASVDTDAAHRSGWTNPAARGNTFTAALPFPDGFRAQLDLGPLTIWVSNPNSNPNHSTSKRSDEGLQI
jgi:hypothetical protein